MSRATKAGNIPHMKPELLARIDERLKALNLSDNAACEKAGINRDTIRDLRRGKRQSLTGVTLVKLAEALETTASWLLENDQQTAVLASNVRPADVEPPNIRELLRDLPVYGTTAGSHKKGSVQISSDPVDYVRRPPALIGVKNAYSLFVEGESMAPRHCHGDLIFVRADRKARVGDDVVVILQNGEHEDRESFIAKLLKLGADEIIIGKLNPAAEIVLDRTKVHAIHRVLTMADLFGV